MEKRQIIETTKEKLLPNNRYGTVSKGLNWLPLSNDENLEHEVYIVHFEPDSSSNFHRHNGYEEFYVLNGELIDDNNIDLVYRVDDGNGEIDTVSARLVR